MKILFSLCTLISLTMGYGCPKQININGDEFQLDLFDATYKSLISGSSIVRDTRNARVNVWIYFRKNYPTVIVTSDKCPSSDSNWFQWNVERAQYVPVNFNTDEN